MDFKKAVLNLKTFSFLVVVIVLMLFSFAVVIANSQKGLFQQLVFDPFGDVVGGGADEYEAPTNAKVSKRATFTENIISYSDLINGYTYLNPDVIEGGLASEPYCRRGGTYTFQIYNDPNQGEDYIYNYTSTLFHCSTTHDLLQMIKIPSSWSDSELLIYCNDGGIINFQKENFDFLSTIINNYKVCILKNMDLIDNNTIVYGLEVGNREIDDSPLYLFDQDKKSNYIVANFEFESIVENQEMNEAEPYEIYIPYVTIPSYDDSGSIFSTYEDKRPVYGPDSPCLNDFDNPCNDEATKYIRDRYTDAAGIERISDFDNLEMSKFSFNLSVNYNITTYEYIDNDTEKIYYLRYDPYFSFYSLYSPENLDTPLREVFPTAEYSSDFDLSRVALFRSFGDIRIYGYEEPIKLRISGSGNHFEPVYKITMPNTFFTKTYCENMLAAYSPSDALTISDSLKCSTVSDRTLIEINTRNIDGSYGEGSSFNLFRKVILGIISE